jgi:hypothetical protein
MTPQLALRHTCVTSMSIWIGGLPEKASFALRTKPLAAQQRRSWCQLGIELYLLRSVLRTVASENLLPLANLLRGVPHVALEDIVGLAGEILKSRGHRDPLLTCHLLLLGFSPVGQWPK